MAVILDAAKAGAKTLFAIGDLFLGTFPGPRILIYHQVGESSRREMEVTPAAFRAHIQWLLSRRRVVDLETALRERGSTSANDLVVITFDDGYADLYEIAFPVMKRESLPFTLYLSTEHVEESRPLIEGSRPLTWEQIEKMADSGLMTLGSHTHRHLDLRYLSPFDIEEQLSRCDDLIAKRIGISPRHFAYPWGYWSPDADRAVRQRYESSALGGGHPVTARTDRYLIHRLPIQRSDRTLFFRRKVNRGMRLEERARRVIRGYRGP